MYIRERHLHSHGLGCVEADPLVIPGDVGNSRICSRVSVQGGGQGH